MDISGDTSLFLDDFGADCVFGSVSFKGILDQPEQVVLDGMAISEEYVLTFSPVDVTLSHGDSITVSDVAFTVKEVRAMDDGAFKKASLSKT